MRTHVLVHEACKHQKLMYVVGDVMVNTHRCSFSPVFALVWGVNACVLDQCFHGVIQMHMCLQCNATRLINIIEEKD